MCTYQMINILNRNATTRNLVGKLTVWLYISLSKMFRSRTQRQDGKYTCIYVYIFKQIFVP